MMKAHKLFKSFVLIVLVLLAGCGKEPEPAPPPANGKVLFKFHHYCEGTPIEYDARKYINQAGNEYMVNEIQYFISDVVLYRIAPGQEYTINAWKDIHYIDSDIPSTQEWNVFDNIPEGAYSFVKFTFGITEEKNITLMYTDPPESLMFWPQYLGGGYHYMKLNGKWLDPSGLERPYNFHLGIGQIYDATSGEITGFIQNHFEVVVPESGFEIRNGETTQIDLVMHIDRWFKNPHTYDHNVWGGDIMQKQDAMNVGCENGQDVFGVLSVEFCTSPP